MSTSIKNIFDEIANESSTNKKMEILGKYKDNELLKRVLYLANSKRIKFYIKQIPEYTKGQLTQTLVTALDGLTYLSGRQLTGGLAVEHLKTILSGCEPDDAYIIERIIDKDCKIGMGTSNMNKVMPKLIEDTPYMGAKAFSEELARKIFKDGDALSQMKMDGRYCNAIIRSGDVELESRQGEPTTIDGAAFIKELSKYEDCVLNGELTIDNISRYESNGIIASLVSIGNKKLEGKNVEKEIAAFEAEHMGYQEALDKIRFSVWDKITVDEYFATKSSRTYEKRFGDLSLTVAQYDDSMISIVETRLCKTYEEAMQHFQDMLVNGHEGTILKSLKGAWKDGKPNWQVKMKLEMTVDLRIVRFNFGTKGTKNENVISSIDVQSSCGKLVTSPAGINEKMMKYITDNQDKLSGTILETTCSGLSQNKAGEYALLHPRFSKLRDDKDTCDSLESIREIENMAKGLVTT